jgi:hypothetical protein
VCSLQEFEATWRRWNVCSQYLKCCSNGAMEPLAASPSQAAKASGGCESLAQLIRITVHPANLAPLLEDTPLFLVGKALLELPLFGAKPCGARRPPRWR